MENTLREKYLQSLKLNKNYSDEALENMRVMCEKVTEKMTNSFGRNNTGSGLLVGEVQSGKTSNFIALTVDVIEKNMFDVVVILGGVINDLKKQTKERFDNFVSGSSHYRMLDVNSNMIEQYSTFKEEFETTDDPIILFCLKEKQNLTTLNKLIENLNKRILIIDDESDQATPNNEKVKTNEFGERKVEDELSKIHELVNNLKYSNQETFLLLVTATPYSNILSSSKYNTSPKWGYVLTSGEGYKGLDEFHQEFDDYRDNKIRNLSKFVDSNGKEGRLTVSLKTASIEELSWFKKELKSSLLSYVVGNESFNFIEDKNENFEMLIHSHFKKTDHSKIEEYVEEYFNTWISLNQDDDEYELKITGIKNEIDIYSKQLPNDKKDKLIENKDLIVERCFIKLKNWKKNIKILVDNSNNKNDKEAQKFLNHKKDIVIIGADKIQRGITFEKLRLVFMPRLAVEATADTILQRARWFGYRGDMFEYMTIFLPNRLKWLFNSYVDIKEEINSFLELSFYRGENIRNIDKVIRIPSDKVFGRLTRKTINMIEGNAQKSNSSIQKCPVSNVSIEDDEITKLINFGLNDHFKEKFKYEFHLNEVPIDKVNKKFLEVIFKKMEYINNVETFIEYCKSEGIKTITFTLMNVQDDGSLMGRKRSLKSDEVIPEEAISEVYISNLFRGRSEKYKGNNDHNKHYAGDRDILEKYISQLHPDGLNTLEIQIHNVIPRIGDYEYKNVYMYALKLPNKKEIAYIQTSKAEM